MLTDFFDTMGTVTGIAAEADLATEDGTVPAIGPVLLVDSVGGDRGRRGGISRTRPTSRAPRASRRAVGRGSPLWSSASCSCSRSLRRWSRGPVAATAPALVLVGYLMARSSGTSPVDDAEDGLPALLTIDAHAADVQHHGRHRRRIHQLGADQGRPRQDRRGPSADVGRRDRVPRVLRCRRLDRRWSTSCQAARRSDRTYQRAPLHGGGSGARYHSRDVRTHRAAGGAARHLRPAAGNAVPGDGRVRPRREPSARAATGRRRALHGAPDVQGHPAYPTTRAVSEAIEGVGGTFNAATDRESTVYWTRLPGREAERAVDVLAS